MNGNSPGGLELARRVVRRSRRASISMPGVGLAPILGRRHRNVGYRHAGDREALRRPARARRLVAARARGGRARRRRLAGARARRGAGGLLYAVNREYAEPERELARRGRGGAHPAGLRRSLPRQRGAALAGRRGRGGRRRARRRRSRRSPARCGGSHAGATCSTSSTRLRGDGRGGDGGARRPTCRRPTSSAGSRSITGSAGSSSASPAW